MKKLSYFLAFCFCLSFGAQAFAADFEWSGIYRIEGYHLKDQNLGGGPSELDYGLHHLSLRPKIVAGDGVLIQGQFDLLTNSDYPDSQLGAVIGNGVGSSTPTNSDDSNALSNHQASDQFSVSQLYLTWTSEYGALIAGRAPIHFGLGMTYNAGRGLFDHWYETRDMVGYKIVVGNLYFLPMYGKVNEGNLNQNDDVVDYMIQMQYENPETDLEMGIFYRVRKIGDSGSDLPLGAGKIGGGGAVAAPANNNELSLFAVRDTNSFRLGIEGSFMSGDIGAKTSGGDTVGLNGFGVAAELEYRPDGSKWQWGLKAGAAKGDDPTTDGKFEGFAFSRNYDVAMLLFNHPLGRNDVLNSHIFGGGPDLTTNEVTHPDVESLTNTMYVAPYANYKWTDKLNLRMLVATGNLDVKQVTANNTGTTTSVGSQLGFETDFSLSYVPRKGVTWINQVGLLFPGSAFDYNNEKAGFAYGFESKAAISF